MWIRSLRDGCTGVALGFASCNACHMVHFALGGRDLVAEGGLEAREELGRSGAEPVEPLNRESLHEQIAVSDLDRGLREGGSPAFRPSGGSRLV